MSNTWPEQRDKLKIIYQEKGIIRCEAKLVGCAIDFAMSFHHRHKRWWYIRKPAMLGEFNQTILVCAYCHDKLEASRGETELMFNKLRYKE